MEQCGTRDAAVDAFVADALADATPRVATLALLRFDEYLDLMRRCGIDLIRDGALGQALRARLQAICLGDGAVAPSAITPQE
jgi:hypothetical protein